MMLLSPRGFRPRTCVLGVHLPQPTGNTSRLALTSIGTSIAELSSFEKFLAQVSRMGALHSSAVTQTGSAASCNRSGARQTAINHKRPSCDGRTQNHAQDRTKRVVVGQMKVPPRWDSTNAIAKTKNVHLVYTADSCSTKKFNTTEGPSSDTKHKTTALHFIRLSSCSGVCPILPQNRDHSDPHQDQR